VDADGRARITGFGLAPTAQNLDPDKRSRSARWTAPEVSGGWTTCGEGGDVFSFAMVTIEVCYE